MKKLLILINFLALMCIGCTTVYNTSIRTIKTPVAQSTKRSTLSESEAKGIAEKTCIKGGETLAPGFYNETSKTWWFDANLNATREECNPACVVNEENKTTEINWRCTGLLQQKDN